MPLEGQGRERGFIESQVVSRPASIQAGGLVMADVEARYLKHGEPVPDGWERSPLGHPHGHHACLITRHICQCGKPLAVEDRGHHIVTTCCGQVRETCCGDI